MQEKFGVSGGLYFRLIFAYSENMLPPVPGLVRWLYLDLNSYFASVEQQLRPELRNRPVAVIPVEAETTCCIAASYEAKAFGVQTGTPVKEARRLCPEIVFVLAQHREYARFHHLILGAVDRCLPVDRVFSVDEIGCRLTGSQCQPEKALAIARRLKERIRMDVGECLRCSIGLAPNSLLAKIATDMEKPDGLVLLDVKDLPEILCQLQLRDIPGIGRRMEARLRAKGICSMRDLLAFDTRQMRAAWGNLYGERYWYWLRGYEFDGPASVPRSVGHQHVLPPRLRTLEKAEAVAQKMLAQAASRLRSKNLWARSLSVSLGFSKENQPRSWQGHARTLETQNIFALLEAFKRIWANCPPGTPVFVGIQLSDLVPGVQHSEVFFPEEQKRQKLSLTMDSIRTQFGENALYLGGTHVVRDTDMAKVAFASIPDPKSFQDSASTRSAATGKKTARPRSRNSSV